jgi:pimeloyl-ACP methyl ester carboxylesterase
MRARRLRTGDGAELTWYEAGDPAAVPMVLLNGLGGGWLAWRPVIEHFGSRFRLLSWDYRGLYASGPAARLGHYSIHHHVRDLLALLEESRAEEPILLGWSMGVQISLELCRTHPGLPRGIVAIHGTAGRPLRTAFDWRFSEAVLGGALRAVGSAGRRLDGVLGFLADRRAVSDGVVRLGQRLGVMARRLDRDRFHEIAREWVRLDLAAYASIFGHLNEHDASDCLSQVSAPVLVVTGGCDRFTPHHLGRRLAESLPRADHHHLQGATHFGLFEYPSEIIDAVERFLRERLGLEAPA